MNPQIKKLEKSDLLYFIQLVRLFEDVFEMKDFSIPPATHLQRLLSDETFIVFVAVDDNSKVIGGLTAYTLTQYYATRPLVYIFDLAVATDFQRQGIGQQLISAINSYCRQAGMEEVFVQADKTDGYAIDFYRKNKPGDEEEVVHFYWKM